MSDEIGLSALGGLVRAFGARAREEFQDRLQQWPTDMAQSEVHEVIGGLLARQVTLAVELVGCPPIWNEHVAPLLLRAMADVHISLMWVLGDPSDRCRKFIHYGLGQEKLLLEHRRAVFESRPAGAGDEEQRYLQATEDWLNAQRAIFLTDVNLGSWSGNSTRERAEATGCLDFYNFVYSPFSACVHSTWQHIARNNLRQCHNQLHRYHSVPVADDADIEVRYAVLAGKYLQKTFDAFDSATNTSYGGQSAFELMNQELDSLESCSPEQRISLVKRLRRWWTRVTS